MDKYNFMWYSVSHTKFLILFSSFSNISVVMESSETSIAQAFWFIGMMVAIAVLILFLIVVCFFKRSRGEKYHGKHTVEISVLTFIFVSVYESLVIITDQISLCIHIVLPEA